MTSKQAVLKLYKNRGETPLECLERFKIDNPEYKNEKMTYAGRLDPLAEGLLLVLVGDECKNKEKYLGLDKEYEVDVLFGFATDTYDLLGKVTEVSLEASVIPAEAGLKLGLEPNFKDELSGDEGVGVARFISRKIPVIQNSLTTLDSRLRGNDMQVLLQFFVGKFSQKYPAYSSKNIKEILKIRNGKNQGLALRKSEEMGKGESSVFSDIDEDIAQKDVEIKNIEFLSERTISKKNLEKYIVDSINLVKGDFRQNEILKIWQTTFDRLIRENGRMIENHNFNIISIRVNCTSGTYMRSLANSIGEKIGVPALALNIKRTRIGDSY